MFLISVAEYDDESYNLSFVHNDNACIKRGFVDGLLIPESQIITCGMDCHVTYSDFQSMISSHSDKIALSDRVIVFFSGHGGGAPFSLKFSDISIVFSEFCDAIDTLSAHAKILIIDSCYSGSGEIPELSAEEPSNNLFEYTNSGFAFFASSSTGNTSTCHPEREVSLYTHCFSNALCNARIHNGKISLIDVAKQAALDADYLAKTHGKTLQHPVYKCYIPGDVLFKVTEEGTEEKNIYSSYHEEFDVYSTEILHSTIEMRYSVFAISKTDINDELIANYTKQIVNEVKHLRKFQNPSQERKFFGKSLNVVFVYWGKNETDIVRRNWCYRSIWASPLSDRANWYRLDEDSKIVSDIWIKPHKLYCLLEEMNARNEVSNTELLKLTHNIANPLLRAAREVVKYFEEYENGEIPESAFIQACTEHFKVIHHCYWKMANLPLSSIELKEWADCYNCLTAVIDDMRIYYTTKTFLDRDERNRKICMRGTVTRYRIDLQRLTHIENDLVKSGLICVDTQ